MELVKTHIGLVFSEAYSPWLEMRNILRVVGNNPSIELQGLPSIIDLKGKKQKIILQISSFEIIQEELKSLDDSTNIAIDKLVKLNSKTKLPKIDQITYDCSYIEPAATPFHELLILIKERFVKPSALVDPSTDIGLIFDQTEGNIFKHFQVGPMKKEQLQAMYLSFQRDNIPDNFIFVADLRYHLKEKIEFDAEKLNNILYTACQWNSDQAKSVFNYLEKGGELVMSTDTAIIIHNQIKKTANVEEIPVPFQPPIDEDADSLVWRQINSILHKSLSESGYPQPSQVIPGESYAYLDLPMLIVVAPGIAVGEDEYNKRYKDIDLEQYRQKMSPELFKAFVRHIGRIPGRTNLNLNDIVTTPE